MPVNDSTGRRQCIPILYTKGTHYEVGYDMGRTFSDMIHNFLKISTSLNKCYLSCYDMPEGRKAYEDTLNCVKTNFPQYVRELEGIADGAKVPFHKVNFLYSCTVS
ncbi:unnamed protein product [Callosobruchus maculatus]|uniref:Uncharacterized protein n=1 Tax=Callosobruchus maculatus TaxID=64391 RepID=A0A653BJK6_CALMS|nr:unnamed protein product [Callosobruchus maculatus]